MKVKIEADNGQKVTVRKTRAELIAQALVGSACTTKPRSVAAFRTIYEFVEAREEEKRRSTDRDLTRSVLQMLMERKVQRAEICLPPGEAS